MCRSVPQVIGVIRVVTAAAFVAGATAMAAPAHADAVDDAFVAALNRAGIHYDNAEAATQLAKQVCPQLVGPGKSFGAAVSRVQGGGIPPQMAAFFAGMAVKLYCPAMMKSVTDGTFFDWIQAPHM
ncbi:hypothetical protein BOH72_01940 [Mycobacterium sp. WY10]|nr:hypothetical protein BOH72_01940 [Mycobacterium sp. WY10]